MVMFKISILLILLGFDNKNEPRNRLMIWLIQNKKLILKGEADVRKNEIRIF